MPNQTKISGPMFHCVLVYLCMAKARLQNKIRIWMSLEIHRISDLQKIVGIWQHLDSYSNSVASLWRIRLNHPCAALMRPCVKLLWPLVMVALC